MDISPLLETLTGIMSITGCEERSSEKIRELIGPLFDSCETTPAGSHVLIRKCGLPDAPRVLIDAHFDEIGMMVKEITGDGFLRVTNVGGIDARIMPASRLKIYGKRTITGIVSVHPPHVLREESADKLTGVRDIYIDTGYSGEELREIVRIGTPVGFEHQYTQLENRRVAVKSLDNKACVAAAVMASELILKKDIGFDLILLLSSAEEIGGRGAVTAVNALCPNVAFVLDVELANEPDEPEYITAGVGEGPTVSKSMSLDRKLTDSFVSFAEKRGKKPRTVISARSTGTNADHITMLGNGVPAMVIGIPLRCMHTMSEIVELSDIEEAAELLADYISEELAVWMNR
ncbi:MAG: M20/M25/M40 family metallo-hydrolase [Firmicutes bacterium]|nr:M20/M25/M40 family metallo-hydrolase [Bacillota bacterium]